MSVDQNEIDALLSSGGHIEENKEKEDISVDDLVAKTLAEEDKSEVATSKHKTQVASKTIPAPQPDTSALSTGNSEEQARAAQKILFEVFSNIPDKKDRSRLLNWANDAFIKSKFF